MASITTFSNNGRIWRLAMFFAVVLMISVFISSPFDHMPHSLLRRSSNHVSKERDLLSSIESAGESVAGAITGAGSSSSGAGSIVSAIGGLITGNSSGLISELVEPAGYLGNGLAMGMVAGMMSMAIPKSNASGLNLAAQNLGSGLTQKLVSSMAINPNMSDTTAKAMMTNGTMMMMVGAGTINGAVLALAQGLGSGTSTGLNLSTQSSMSADFNTTGVINGAAGNLGFGLTNSLLSNINTTSLLSSAGSFVNVTDLVNGGTILGSTLNQIAAGAGTGLGAGSSLGLGLQNQAAMPMTPNGSAGAAQDFTMGLTSSFLQGGTFTKIASSLMTSMTTTGADKAVTNSSTTSSASSALSNLNIAVIAQGFAVGLLTGAGNTLAGDTTPPMQMSMFNDSVGGAATGFGLGLGAQGTTLAKQVIANPSQILGNLTGTNAKRGIINKRDMIPASRVSVINRRDTGTTGSTGNTSFIDALNATTLDPLLQMGINTIGCAGIGGFASIGAGLLETGTIKVSDLSSLLNMNIQATNTQTFTIENEGNVYDINLATMDIKINGNGVVGAAVALVLHILFAFIVYYNIAPTIILFHTTNSIAALSGRTSPFPSTPLLRTWTPRLIWLTGPPLALVTFILGFVVRGNKNASVSAHAILGILLFIVTLFNVGIAPARVRENNALLQKSYVWATAATMFFATLVLFSGFVDLAGYTFCAVQAAPIVVWIGTGVSILMPVIGAGILFGVQWLLEKKGQAVKNEKSGSYFDVEEGVDRKIRIGKPTPITTDIIRYQDDL